MTIESSAQCVADVHAVLGEGPVWVRRESALYWVDIKGLKIFRLMSDGKLTEWPTPMRVGSLAPRKSGGFIGGTEDGIAAIDPTADRFEILFNPEEDLPGNRFNDGKVDRQRPLLGGHDGRRGKRGERHALPDRADLSGMRSTAAIKSPMARRSAPTATSCTTTIRRGS